MTIPSPCISVCVTDPDSDLCYGCARTTPEIAKWSKYTDEEKKQVIPCYAGRSNMVVWGDGAVSSCEMLPAVGNINEKSIDQILESESLKKQKESIKNKECHCTHNCAMLTSIMYNPKKWGNLIYQKKP